MKRLIIVVVIFGIMCGVLLHFQDVQITEENIIKNEEVIIKTKDVEPKPQELKEIDDWRLVLVNYEHALPKDFEVELASIDEYRKFDKRAIDKLFAMQKAMKKDGITNVWVQSSYRSVSRQQELFDKKVQEYISLGNTKEKAEELTSQVINKPRHK